MGETGKVVGLQIKAEVKYEVPLHSFNHRLGEYAEYGTTTLPKEFTSKELDVRNVAQTQPIVDEFVETVKEFTVSKKPTQYHVTLCKTVVTGSQSFVTPDHGEYVERPTYDKSCDTILYTGPAPVEAQALLGWVTSSAEMLALKGEGEGEKEATAALPETGAARGYGAQPAPADQWYKETGEPTAEQTAEPKPVDFQNYKKAGVHEMMPLPSLRLR